MGNQKSCCVHTDHPTRHKYVIDGHQITCTNGIYSTINHSESTGGFGKLLRRVKRTASHGGEEDLSTAGLSHVESLRGINGSGNVRFRDHPQRLNTDGGSGSSNQQAAGNSFSLRRSLSILQHISEREPDDTPGDPSNSPTARTIFISCSRLDLCKVSRSKSAGRVNEAKHNGASSRLHHHTSNHCDNPTSQYHNHNSGENGDLVSSIRSGRKSNSCSTIFISDSTPSQPNLKYMLKAVSLALYFHLRNPQFGSSYRSSSSSTSNGHHQSNGYSAPPNVACSDIFDERLHPLWLEPANGGDLLPPGSDHHPNHHPPLFASASSFAPTPRMPDFRTIYRFFRMLFHSAQLTAECAVVSLIYLERIITCAELQLTPATWRRLSLGSVLLASKVWDDQAVWNVDFCSIIKNVSVEEMNELERIVLELIQFNINVPSSVYTKYFFDLRSLATEHGLQLPAAPLCRERAARLEAVSWIRPETLANATSAQQTGSQSNQQGLGDTNGARPDTNGGAGLAVSPGASHGGSPSSLHRSRSTDHLTADRYRSRQSIVIS